MLYLATTLGYGPRYLHSTGQYHKGGPNNGLFIQLTAFDGQDAPIPGQPYTFVTFLQAQALGDLEALRQHGRRVLRIDLGSDLHTGLDALRQAIEAALTGISVAVRQPEQAPALATAHEKSLKDQPSVTKRQRSKAGPEREQSRRQGSRGGNGAEKKG